ncbi:hypothetical protein VTK73DRAFT_6928 [Phialemonium thermophilum]|uniref:Uncharacterized protein n=1 Tax=Phialemonium thermophilum TaxID=223376 RepID=A0ABR3WHN4_9PEZI
MPLPPILRGYDSIPLETRLLFDLVSSWTKRLLVLLYAPNLRRSLFLELALDVGARHSSHLLSITHTHTHTHSLSLSLSWLILLGSNLADYEEPVFVKQARAVIWEGHGVCKASDLTKGKFVWLRTVGRCIRPGGSGFQPPVCKMFFFFFRKTVYRGKAVYHCTRYEQCRCTSSYSPCMDLRKAGKGKEKQKGGKEKVTA